MTVTHTERFTPVVTASTAFQIRTFPLNPGLNAMFPWLSDVANRYEKYKFRRVMFRYVPQSAAVTGTATLAFDFDPNDDPPSSMDEATTFHDYVSTSVWNAATLSIDLANGDRLPQKNTRPGLPGADIDLNVYDVGQLHILTEGAAASTVGYVEVSYVVDLFIHQVQAGIGGSCTATSGLDATHLIGSNFNVDPDGFVPIVNTSTAVATFTQPFQGLMGVIINGTTISAFAPVFSASGTATIISGTYNAAAGLGVLLYAIKAVTGTTMTPTITAAAVSDASYVFGRAAYAALNFI